MHSFLCVSAKFQPISASFTPVRRKEDGARTAANRGERPTLIMVDYFLKYCLDSHFASAWVRTDALHLFVPGKRKFRFSRSCRPAPNVRNLLKTKPIDACPESVPFGDRCSRKGLGRNLKYLHVGISFRLQPTRSCFDWFDFENMAERFLNERECCLLEFRRNVHISQGKVSW